MALSAMVVALIFGTGGAGGGFSLNPPWLDLPASLVIALIIGAIVGSMNAFLVVSLGINAFIVTLASYIWGRGLVVALSGGRSVYRFSNSMRIMAIQRPLGVPMLGWTLILVYVVFAFVLTKTPFGRHLVMIGGNAVATFRAGIRVGRVITAAFVLSGVLAGFAGWLLASRTAGATANLGIGLLFQAFAAVVIGGVSLKGGYGRFRCVRRRASPQLSADRDQCYGHAAALHADDPGRACACRSPRHPEDDDPTPLPLMPRCWCAAQDDIGPPGRTRLRPSPGYLSADAAGGSHDEADAVPRAPRCSRYACYPLPVAGNRRLRVEKQPACKVEKHLMSFAHPGACRHFTTKSHRVTWPVFFPTSFKKEAQS